MTAVEQASAVADSSTERQDLLTLQRDSFLKEGHVEYSTRIDRLNRCINLLVDNQPAICGALEADYGGRSPRFTRMSEVMTSVGNLKNTSTGSAAKQTTSSGGRCSLNERSIALAQTIKDFHPQLGPV